MMKDLRCPWAYLANEIPLGAIIVSVPCGLTGLRRRRFDRFNRSLEGAPGHELILAVPPEPIWLNADPLRLARVVGNLLNNASKFTEHGGCIHLTVALKGEEAS